jgi:CheY-like chemotaxis protein
MNGIPVTIVAIEDDPGHARLIEKNVRRAGVTNDIVGFADGTSALAYLFGDGQHGAAANPVLVLLDLNLPDMSGVDILARVKSDERLKRTPVVVLTTTSPSRSTTRRSPRRSVSSACSCR